MSYEHYDWCFKCVKVPDGWQFRVAQIYWTGPHSPHHRWINHCFWESEPTQSQLDFARESAFQTPRFFQTCKECKEINNVGHMWRDGVCQSCAERNHGVCF